MRRAGWWARAVLAGLAALAELGTLAPVFAQEKAVPPEHAMVMPDVDQHLKILTEKLALTADQQEKARPILKEMQGAMQKDMDDKSLTSDQMHEKMHSDFMKADKEFRTFLSEEQKTKLDAMEAEMHRPKSDQ
jgi:hypothetical protein